MNDELERIWKDNDFDLIDVLPLNLPGETKGSPTETSIRIIGVSAETRTKYLVNGNLGKPL
jgi:hypothetical protein